MFPVIKNPEKTCKRVEEYEKLSEIEVYSPELLIKMENRTQNE